MSLRAQIALQRGAFSLDVALEVADGRTVGLVGPNASGKSTLVEALAGLLPLSSGVITLDDRVLERPSERIRLRPQDRPIGVMFQGLWLFPHLSVIDNVAYGLWARGARRRSARAQVQPLLERLDLWPLRDRLPAALSGGEAQRVALARALAPEPRLLVLDEPLSALDVESRPRTRGLLQRALAEFSGPRLVITHDPLEALLLADHLVVLEGGRVSQAGPTDSVRRHPATRYVATLAGVNLLEGLLEIRAGERALATHGLLLGLGPDANALAAGAALRATVHPGAVHLSQTAPPGDGANTWQAQVETLELEGDRVRIRLTRPEGFFAELTANAIELRSFAPGTQVFATVSPKDIYFYT